MPGVLRQNIDSATSLIIQGSSKVFISGSGIVRVGDMEENGFQMIQGSNTVFADGIAVCRVGDLDNNGEPGGPGSIKMFAGG